MQRKHQFIVIWPLAFGAAALCGLSRPAHAGYWQLEKYVFQGETIKDENVWENETNLARNYEFYRTFNREQDPSENGYFGATGYWTVRPQGNTVGSGNPVKDPGAVKARALGQAHAVLKWVRNTAYDMETGEEYPDPNDNPPAALWIYEKAEAEAVRILDDYTHPYDENHVYDGTPINLESLGLELGSEHGAYRNSGPQRTAQSLFTPDGYGNPWAHLIDNKSGYNLYRVNTRGQDVVHLPSTSFAVSAEDGVLNWHGKEGKVFVNCRYKAQVVSLNLLSRRQGFAGPPTDGSSIAAGGNNDERHKAEIWVDLRDAETGDALYDVPISMLPPLKFRDNSEKGAQLDAVLLDAAHALDENGQAEIDPNSRTDGNGRALIALMKSSDRVKPLDLTNPDQTSYKVAVVFDAKANPTPITTVGQRWDEKDQWEYTPPLLLEGDPVKVRFKPECGGKSFNGGPETIKIRQHSIKFVISKVRILYCDPVTHKPNVKVVALKAADFSEDDPATSEVDPDPATREVGSTADYGEFDALAVEDSEHPGEYTANLTLHPSEDVTIEKLWFKAEDQGVFLPPPSDLPNNE